VSHLQALASQGLVLAVVLPLIAFTFLGLGMLIGHPPRERRVHQLLAVTHSASLVFASAVLLGLGLEVLQPIRVDLGTLVAVRGYHFDLSLFGSFTGVLYLWLTVALCGLVGAFSAPYLHQDEGYHRFYLLLVALTFGLSLIAVGAGLDLVFAGWEVVGLSSALLIAYFVRRPAPVAHGLMAFGIYRTTDVGLLLALVSLHHYAGTTSLDSLGELDPSASLWVGALIVFGAMGKGAIVPFTPWLPRAMEGPTPSSAIFYGALSIHASPFLLLRITPILDQHAVLQAVVLGLGSLTALHASTVGRVQTDVKCCLGYASVAQVGLIWMWIGMGFYTIATLHLASHAVMRTWQLLRAPSLLHDRHRLMQFLGTHVSRPRYSDGSGLLSRVRRKLYRFALERWYLDDLLGGITTLARQGLNAVDAADRRWARVLGGGGADAADEQSTVEPLEVRSQ